MQLSRGFVGLMGVLLLFLIAAYATEETRCIARARRVIERMFMPIPASIAAEPVHSANELFRFASLGGESCLRPEERGG